MSANLKEPSQLVIGMTHRQMLDVMAEAGIFCSHDGFARILQDVQKRAIDSMKPEKKKRAKEQA